MFGRAVPSVQGCLASEAARTDDVDTGQFLCVQCFSFCLCIRDLLFDPGGDIPSHV